MSRKALKSLVQITGTAAIASRFEAKVFGAAIIPTAWADEEFNNGPQFRVNDCNGFSVDNFPYID